MRLSWQALILSVKQALAYLKPLKPYLRWIILGATLFFIASTLRQHWNEVKTLRITSSGWSWLILSLEITLLAHVWTGWVWSWILRALGQPAAGRWGVSVYLTTNIAKYLPGNVWHLYGRILAAKQVGFPTGAATLSVLLEPLLMAAAALVIALLNANQNRLLQGFCLAIVLLAIHPKTLNPLVQLAGRLKGKSSNTPEEAKFQLGRYPLLPFLGEIGFVILRGIGFLMTLQALQSIVPGQIPAVLSAFSIAWVMGLVIPGAPGGIGVFEAVALGLLDQQFSTSIILGSVALYRLISTLAEVSGAGIAYLARRR